MKKMIVTACAAIASAVALASTVESSNTFGVLKVSTGNTTKKQLFVAVPWEDVGATGSAIDPTKLVLASNLNNDDMLYVYGAIAPASGEDFGAWKVTDGAWVATTVSKDAVTYTSSSDGLPRGTGFVIETAKDTIYLSGQYASTAASVSIAPATAAKSPAYTLIGGNLAEAIDLNAVTATTGTIDRRDEIRLSLTESYTRDAENKAWQKVNGTRTITIGNETRTIPNTTTDGVTLPAGKGAWYVRYGTGDLTLTLPAKN